MNNMLKKMFCFLFCKYFREFRHFCYTMLIPCFLSPAFCRWWLFFMAFILMLATEGTVNRWDKGYGR